MHMFPGRRISSAATASSARRCRSAPGSPSPKVSRERRCLPDLFRRRRGQPGPGLRKLQHGGAVEAAGDLVIENNQYAMGTSVARSSAPTDLSAPGRGLRHSRASRSTAWMCAAVRGRRKAVQWCRAARADHPRNEDLSLSRPFHVGSGEIPHQARKCRRCAASTTRSTTSSARLDGTASSTRTS